MNKLIFFTFLNQGNVKAKNYSIDVSYLFIRIIVLRLYVSKICTLGTFFMFLIKKERKKSFFKISTIYRKESNNDD